MPHTNQAVVPFSRESLNTGFITRPGIAQIQSDDAQRREEEFEDLRRSALEQLEDNQRTRKHILPGNDGGKEDVRGASREVVIHVMLLLSLSCYYMANQILHYATIDGTNTLRFAFSYSCGPLQPHSDSEEDHR